MDEILWCYHSNETSSAVLSRSTIYLVCSSNFWVCRWNPMMWLFTWKLSVCTFIWCYLFVKILVEICLWLHLAVKGLIELHVACKKWKEKTTTTAQRIQMNLNTSCNKIALNFQSKKVHLAAFIKKTNLNHI